MKKFLAGLTAAAMVAFPVSAFAEETAAGTEVKVVGGIEYAGQAVEGTLDVKADADDDKSLAFSLGIPAGDSTVSLDLGEVVRYVDDTVYVNAGGAANFYQLLTGDTSVTEALQAVGVNDWVAVEPLPVPALNEESVAALQKFIEWQPSEQLIASIEALSHVFVVAESEEAYTINLNNQTVISFVDKIDELLADNKDELAAYAAMLDLGTFLNLIDYRTTFGPYVNAYAEGRASVTGEDPAAVTEEVFGMLDQYLDEIIGEYQPAPIDFDSIPDLSDALAEALGDAVINGNIVVAKDFSYLTANFNVTADGEAFMATIDARTTETGVKAECKVFQNGQEVAASTFTASVDENGFTAVLEATQGGQNLFTLNVAAASTENGGTITAVLSQAGQQVGALNIAFALTGNTLTASAALTQGEAELASAELTASYLENGFEASLAVSVQGQEAVRFEVKGETAENSAKVTVSIISQGQALVGEFEGHYTENGTIEGTYSLTFADQPIVTGSFAAGPTDEGIAIELEGNVSGQDFHVVINVKSNGGDCTIELLNEGEVVMSAKGYLEYSVTDIQGDFDITAPENSVNILDLIYNASAFYYGSLSAEEAITE